MHTPPPTTRLMTNTRALVRQTTRTRQQPNTNHTETPPQTPHPNPQHRPPTPTTPAHPRQQPRTSTRPTPRTHYHHPTPTHTTGHPPPRHQHTPDNNRAHQPAPPRPTTEHTPTTTQQPITEAAANRHRNAAERPQTGPTPARLSPGSGQRRRQAHRTNPQVRIGETEGITG